MESIHPLSIISFLRSVKDSAKHNAPTRYCFILGAGASVSSGISSGATLAKEWYDEIKTDTHVRSWIKKNNVDLNNIANYYSQIYDLRFDANTDIGPAYIETIMKAAKPNAGYALLAQLMNGTKHNVVITTNFDTLLDKSFNYLENSHPFICSHKEEMKFADIRRMDSDPQIIKIHHDYRHNPKNTIEETNQLSDEFKDTLTTIFQFYTPIVIGYGGNDGSLMDFLKSLSTLKPIYWCYRNESDINLDIDELVAKRNGHYLKINDFDVFMLQIFKALSLTYEKGVNTDTNLRNYRRSFDGILDEKNKEDSKLLHVATENFGSSHKIDSPTVLRNIKKGESSRLIIKKVLDDIFAQDACALANAKGGEIYIGITKYGNPTGLVNKNTISKIQNIINTIKPTIKPTITYFDEIIVVAIPEGGDKPHECLNGYFIREGVHSVKLNRQELIVLLERENQIRFDELKNERAVFDIDFDQEKFEIFRTKAKLDKSVEIMVHLYRLGCVTSEHKLTNAGVLLFAKSTEFLISHATITCVLYKGKIKNKVLERKDFDLDVINNVKGCMKFFMQNLKNEYKIESTERIEQLEVPEAALREAIVNAICHRNYFEHGANVIVEIFEDRIKITSPGGLPSGISKDDIGVDAFSKRPNEIIAKNMTRVGLMEKLGTGIIRIKESVKERGNIKVDFSFLEEFVVVTFTRPSLTSTESFPQPSESTSERIKNAIGNYPKISISELAARFKLSTRTIDNHLSKLKKNKEIERIGSKQSGYYIIINRDSVDMIGEPVKPKYEPLSEPVKSKTEPLSEPVNSRNELLNKVQQLIVNEIELNNRITLKEMMVKAKKSLSTIKREIANLKKKDVIERIGSDKSGKWIIK